jgi:opacity protein-like surface antigen
MKKLFLLFSLFVVITINTNAQSGNNQLGIGLDLGIPIGDDSEALKLGIGGQLKGLFGVGTAGQITFTTGYMRFGVKDLPDDFDMSTSIIPLLAGYRHNFSGFYVEPQLGYGIYGLKMKGGGFDESDSEGAFTYAVGLGYAMTSGLDIGARYQGASKDGSSTSLIGIKLGYNFSLGGATMKK